MSEWVKQKSVWMSPKPVLPGVWAHKGGGHVIRGRVTDPRSGKLVEKFEVLPVADAPTALFALNEWKKAIRSGKPLVAKSETKTHFKPFAASLFKERVAKRIIKSASTRELWEGVLRLHLFQAKFASLYLDAITRIDIEQWLETEVSPKVTDGSLSPHTANSWLTILSTIFNAADDRGLLEKNPISAVTKYEADDRESVSVEQPNALLPHELGPFLAALEDLYPQHYAFAYLGFVCGFRPSTMRPLRRSGPTPDVLWSENTLLLRQSETRGEVMGTIKTGDRLTIGVPSEVMDVLRRHVERLPARLRYGSDLLFPAARSRVEESSGFLSATFLTKPFAEAAAAAGIKKRLTAKAMRRTAMDLQRRTAMDKTIRIAVSGHKTEEAKKLYETVDPSETRVALAKVIDLFSRNVGSEVGSKVGSTG